MWVRKRKSTYTYVVHSNGRKKKVTKAYVPNSGSSNDEESKFNVIHVDDIILPISSNLGETPGKCSSTALERPNDQKKYEKAKFKRLENWADLGDKLYQKGLEKNFLNSSTCSQCQIKTADLYRCIDCINYHATCLQCLEKRHDSPHLHIFEKWMHGAYVLFPCSTPLWEDSSHQFCPSSYKKDIVIVDDKGRQHMRTVQFCGCEEESVRLFQYDLWPSSPKHPRLAFHIELLRWLNGLLLECQISAKGFCESLKARQPKLYRYLVTKEGREIYKLLMDETLQQFRQYLYRMNFLSDTDLDNGCACPACYQCDKKIYCFDADFQLVRKTSSGHNWLSPKHHEHFFLDQKKVDDFMSTYSNAPIDNDCSDFQAGSNIRSKAKNKKLSETAVFGATCRHDFPQKFFSLKHGERLGYAVFLIKLFLNENNGQKIHVSYDIACLLQKHLQKNGYEDILENVSLSIPIFHCYGHSVPCQILYGPRRTQDFGLTDGEGIERLWSYLGKFCITKEMTPENRTDLLTDGLLYYGQKIKDKFGDTLVSKFKRASTLEENSSSSLQEIMLSIPGAVNFDIIDQWVTEERLAVMNSNSKGSDGDGLSKSDIYILDLHKYYSIRGNGNLQENHRDDGIAQENQDLARLERKLSAHERKNKITRKDRDSEMYMTSLKTAKAKERKLALTTIRQHVSEKHYLIKLIRKYAKGQSIYNRLSKQLKCATKKVKKSVDEYNKITGPNSNLPQQICLEEVDSVESPIFMTLGQCQRLQCNIPSGLKQEIVQLACLVCRCKEEKELLRQDMLSTFNWYCDQLQKVKRKIGELNSVSPSMSQLIKEGMYLEIHIMFLNETFQEYIGDQHDKIELTLTDNVLSDDRKKMSEMLSYLADVEDLLVDECSDSESDSEEESDNEPI